MPTQIDRAQPTTRLRTIRSDEASDWERNARFYRDDDEAPLMADLAVRRQEFYRIQPGQRVLDVGCGTGGAVARLRARGVDAVGVDYSAAMVEVAREQYGLGDHVICAGVTELPFEDASFDVVMVNGVLHHLAVQEQLADALREFHRLLRPGGMLACFDRNGSLVSGFLTGVCIKLKECLRVISRRALFPSCASRNEIAFGCERDLEAIEQCGFRVIRRRDVSTVPFFLSVVALNTVQYFLSERIRRAVERALQRPVTWIDQRMNWRWCSVEQFVVFAMTPMPLPATPVNKPKNEVTIAPHAANAPPVCA